MSHLALLGFGVALGLLPVSEVPALSRRALDAAAGQYQAYLPYATLHGGDTLQAVDQHGGLAGAIALCGHLAYVADGSRALVVDVADSSAPRIVSRTAPLAGRVVDLDTNCRAMVLGVSDGTLAVYDLADPRQPGLAATTVFRQGLNDVEVEGDRAFVAAGAAGLQVFDLSRPARPRRIGQLAGNTGHVAVRGDRAAINDFDPYTEVSRLRLLDVSDPARPRELARTYGPQDPALGFVGGYLYVLGALLDVFRVSGEPYLQQVMSVALGGGQLAVAGNRVYVAGALAAGRPSTLAVLDASDPAWPVRLDAPTAAAIPSQEGIAASGARVYLTGAGRSPTFQAVDVSDPRTPRAAGGLEMLGSAMAVWADRGIAYVWDDSGRTWLHAVDGTGRLTPGASIEEAPSEIVTSDGMAYVAGEGLHLYDVRDPQAPRLVGEIDYGLAGGCKDLALVADLAFVLVGWNALAVVDVSDPSSPVEVGRLVGLRSYAEHIVADGDHAFVASVLMEPEDFGWFVLSTVDVADRTDPRVVVSQRFEGDARDMVYRGGYAFLGSFNGRRGLSVIDLRDPSRPRLASHLDADYITNLAIAGARVYASSGTRLLTIDVSRPEEPRLVREQHSPEYVDDLAAAAPLLFLADGAAGLWVERMTR